MEYKDICDKCQEIEVQLRDERKMNTDSTKVSFYFTTNKLAAIHFKGVVPKISNSTFRYKENEKRTERKKLNLRTIFFSFSAKTYSRFLLRLG